MTTLLMLPPQNMTTRGWASRLASALPQLSVVVAETDAEGARAVRAAPRRALAPGARAAPALRGGRRDGGRGRARRRRRRSGVRHHAGGVDPGSEDPALAPRPAGRA